MQLHADAVHHGAHCVLVLERRTFRKFEDSPMKFSVRDLFLVTMIVALAAGWWLDRWYLAQENFRLEMREQLRGNPQEAPTKTPERLSNKLLE